MAHVIPFLIVASSFAAFAAAQPVPVGVMPAVAGMTCGDDRITVVIQRDVARVSVRGQSYEMTPVPAASGAKYEVKGDPSTVFWSRGRTAMLTLAGTALPECTMSPPTGQPQIQPPVASRPRFSANGHEPGWRLDVGPTGALTLVTDYGRTTTTVARPDVVTIPGGRIYRGAGDGRDVEVRVTHGPCADAATGLPRPAGVEVTVSGTTLRGCGGEAATLLHGAPWTIDQVAGDVTVDGSRTSIEFRPDGSAGGRASCNTFRGRYTLTAEGLTFGPLVTTRMACAPPVMAQERTVLEILRDVRRFEIAADGALVLHAADGRTLRARR
jgi:heat shock protein HslJ/membrane-bound inhibitor of C-type lysozyme